MPLKFRVFDASGAEVTNSAGIRLITYTQGEVLGDTDPVIGGPGTIRYSDSQFIANWATPRRTNFCYVVRAEAPDGAGTEALFRSR